MAVQTAREQLMLELVNRARLDPQAEADRFGIGLNDDLDPGTLDASAKAPLAMNPLLIDSSLDHSQWMINTNIFSHTGSGGTDAGQRMTAAGYSFTGSWSWGENIAWQGTTGTPNLTAYIYDQHQGLFESAGHRENILADQFREIGVGQIAGPFTYQGTTYNASMITQNFAKSGSNYFITGVAFDDGDGDDFYSVGEARSGVSVTTSAGSTSSNSAGGYTQSVAGGSYDVTFSGGGLASPMTVTVDVSASNVKLDVVDGTTIWSSASLTLGSGATAVKLLGVADLNVTGSNAGENIVGNKGANVIDAGNGADTIDAGAGNDIIFGGFGNDTIDGGAGEDEVDYTGFGGNISVNLNAGPAQTSGGGGVDTITNVENARGGDFADTLTGRPDDTKLWGGAGGDKLFGLGGNDELYGGSANDNIQAGNGNDMLFGEADQDILTGGAGNDILDGGDALDRLVGSEGNDTLIGGGGRDILRGDSFDTGTMTNITGGNDTFVFSDITDSAAGGQRDIIRDLVQGEDTIDLAAIDAISGGSDDAFSFIATAAFTNTAGELRYAFGGSHTIVSGDVDGDSTADFQIDLNGNINLLGTDFLL